MIQRIKEWYNKPLHYPKLLDIEYFKSIKFLNTNEPLYSDPEKVYEEYLLRYKSYDRDQKLEQLGI